MRFFRLAALTMLFNISFVANAQLVTAKFGKGIRFLAPDSSLSVNMGVRFQTLVVAERPLTAGAEVETRMFTRRFRLKFDGFAYNPRLSYKIELALSNADNGNIIREGNNAANIVLDAFLEYEVAPNTSLVFGQFKLPGNRERVISSQKLQFVDRSLVNSRYNLDRDLGLMFQHQFSLGNVLVREFLAAAAGQGRNVNIGNDTGLSYTGRVEVLPFGEFTKGGDYFGSDLAREQTPKLSIGGGFSYNNDASRTRGELGNFVAETRNLETALADLIFKYKGFSVMSEYMNKTAASPLLADSSEYFVLGDGFVIQAGYLFKNNLELAARYATINPDGELYKAGFANKETEYTLGVSRYIVGHNLKIQSDLSYSTIGTFLSQNQDPAMVYRFQVEFAF